MSVNNSSEKLPRIYSEVYGCSANKSDSEIALGLLEKNGFELTNNIKDSDLNLIFTCIVKIPTENRMIYRIKELSRANKPLIVAGCMPKIEKNVIEKINSKVSLLGPNSIQKIVNIAKATLKGEKVVFLTDLRQPKLCFPRIENPVIRITQISTGCNEFCSYCIVRLAKGKLFSYPTDLIVEDIKEAVKNGKKEIWITSQDNAAYNFNGKNLSDLLNEICKIKGKFFVRVGMMNPTYAKEILNELIDAYWNKKIFKFLHLPVQSGSNKILKLMNRQYKVKDFLDIVKKFRKKLPKITLATDVIVGFPSETEEDFKKTVGLIKQIKPDIVNISKFGVRPGTEAARMKQLPIEIINKRSFILHNLVKKINLEKNKTWVDWQGEVLVDEIGKDSSVVSRNFSYKPIVIKEKIKLGSLVKIKIIDAYSNFLIGKLQ